ncbi:MAG: hypothetical protein V4457_12610, partial [Pseudomonadota bacterium]
SATPIQQRCLIAALGVLLWGGAAGAANDLNTPIPQINTPIIAPLNDTFNILIRELNAVFNTGLISLTQTGSGSPTANCGTAALGPYYAFNCIKITDSTVSPAGQGTGLQVSYIYTAAAGTSNRGAINGFIEVDTAPSVNQYFVGNQFVAEGNVASGGSLPGNPRGNLVGTGSYCILNPGAAAWWNCAGEEIDVKITATASVNNLVGLDITSIPGHRVQGTLIDAALVIDTTGEIGPPGWKEAIRIGGYNSTSANTPISAGGTILSTFVGTSTALLNGLDISGLAHNGTGFTYTGDFLKLDAAGNHWTGAGQVIATASSGNHDFVVADGSTQNLVVESVAGQAKLTLNNRAGSQRSLLALSDNNAEKWTFFKETDNSFRAFDAAQSQLWLTVGVSVAGQVVLGESGGSQLTLAPAGGASLTALATSAGGGGLNVCVDTAGVLYKKAACP